MSLSKAPRPFRTIWPAFRQRIVQGEKLFLCLDFDGTLSAIVRNPERAKLSKRRAEILKKIIKLKVCPVAFISGRSLKDLKKRINLPGAYYAGNHGLEIQGARLNYLHPKARRIRKALGPYARILNRKLAGIKGALVENKGLTLSIHYRCVRPSDRAKVKAIAHQAAAPILKKGICRINSGKMVIEIKPDIKWDKGYALRYLKEKLCRSKRKTLVFYAGDDRTDEDAFGVANRAGGITVYVGRRRLRTKARYCLAKISDATKMLAQIHGALATRGEKVHV